MKEMRFKSMENWLAESKSHDEGWGCAMLYANVPDWKKLTRRIVRKEDLYEAPDDDYGFDDNPHITLLWGIHNDEIIDKGIIHNMLQEIPRMKLKTRKIEIFPGDETKFYDVVKFTIEPTDKLLEIRKQFEEELPNTQTYPDYNPHVTIAYVEKGEGMKYVRELERPITFTFDRGVYSEPNYRKAYFDLKKQAYDK